MKLTAKQLRQIIDTLPNPMESRMQERRVPVLNYINPIMIRDSKPSYEPPAEVIFKFDIRSQDWELDINPDAEELKRLRQIEVDFKDVANELRGETFKNIGLRQDLTLAKLRYEHLRSKWWNKLYYKVKFQFTMLKYRIKYALH